MASTTHNLSDNLNEKNDEIHDQEEEHIKAG